MRYTCVFLLNVFLPIWVVQHLSCVWRLFFKYFFQFFFNYFLKMVRTFCCSCSNAAGATASFSSILEDGPVARNSRHLETLLVLFTRVLSTTVRSPETGTGSCRYPCRCREPLVCTTRGSFKETPLDKARRASDRGERAPSTVWMAT